MPSKLNKVEKTKGRCKVCDLQVYLAVNGLWKHSKIHVGAAKINGGYLTLDDQMEIADLLKKVINSHDASPK
jgi:hypothetical protein